MAGYDFNSTSGVDYGFQGNFLDNGIITPDRAWTAKLTEVKQVYQNVAFTNLSNKTLTVKNKNCFTNLNVYDLVYQLLRDGRVVSEGKVEMPSVEPGATGTVSVPYNNALVTGDAEYLLNVSLCLKTANSWAQKGYDVANAQFSLQDRPSILASHTADGGSLNVSGTTVSGTTKDGKPFNLNFSSGKLNSWTYNGTSLIAAGPDFNSTRDIDNDRNGSLPGLHHLKYYLCRQFTPEERQQCHDDGERHEQSMRLHYRLYHLSRRGGRHEGDLLAQGRYTQTRSDHAVR